MSLDVYLEEVKPTKVYWANITHNLGIMAAEVKMMGISESKSKQSGEIETVPFTLYQLLWHPDELNITKASQLIEPLIDALKILRADPEKFCAFNPDNGWGSYEALVQFAHRYVQACRENPDATIRVSR